ncbi:MAG: twin-arginine translocase TatA/TatE family subunit [Deltaproteobacteria bacterium]|nr:twin-arginine translocase TatA/TatE family subunit [Deltaproteobacteria bacterium]
MFGIGFGEFVIIIIVLIVAVGPEQLPSLMRTIGKAIRSMRQASQDLRESIGIDELMNRDFLRPPRHPYKGIKPRKIASASTTSKEEQASHERKEVVSEIKADPKADEERVGDQTETTPRNQDENDEREKTPEESGGESN